MSEEIYEVPQLTKKSDNTDFRNEHNDESIYVNCRPTKFIQPKPEDQATEQHLRRRNLVRAAAVFLALLCLGLVAAVIVLGIENKERNQQNVELQTNYSEIKNLSQSLTQANIQLMNENRRLITERDELKAQTEATCSPTTWINFQNSYYFVSTTLKNWTDSRNMCKDHGADLVIISNFMEQKFISSLNQRVWIGLTDEETENSWKWVSGEAATTTYWREGEPNNYFPAENCVEVNPSVTPIINWNDQYCDFPLKFVCEKALNL